MAAWPCSRRAFRAIAAARDHINIEMYIFQDVRIPDVVGPSLLTCC